MLEQYESIKELNTARNYDNIISTTKKNLDTLSRIIRHEKPYKLHTTQHDEGQYEAHGKIPSKIEMERHQNNNTNEQLNNIQPDTNNNNSPNNIVTAPNTPSNNNGDNTNNQTSNSSSDTVPVPNTPSRTNPLRRNPLQSSILAIFSKAISLRKNKNQSNTEELHDRNRFHRVITTDNCCPKRKWITNQLDLLRLLTLYISLKPHCKHISAISHIASEQFEMLVIMQQ